MPLLEPVTPEMLKKHPYFLEWAKHLGYTPEDVLDFQVEVEVNEDGTELRDEFKTSITFKNLAHHIRTEKWSEGKLGPKPEVKR